MTDPLSSAVFESTGPIDLKIAGDPAALYELSRSLSRVEGKLAGVEKRLGIMPGNVGFFWQGKSFDSFSETTGQHAAAAAQIAAYAKEASSVIDAYGGLIERGRNHFADYADSAKHAGLMAIEGYWIHPPSAPDLTGAADQPDEVTKEAHRLKVDLFKEIRTLVSTWRADADAWIDTYFGPLLGSINELTKVDESIRKLLGDGNELVSATIGEADARVSKDLDSFLDSQRRYEQEWSDYKGDKRSEAPARKDAASKFNEDLNRNARTDLDAKIAKLGPADFLLKGGKALGPLGTAGLAAWDLYTGKSPSTVGAGVAGGVAGSAVGLVLGGALAGATAGIIGGPLGMGVGFVLGGAAVAAGGYGGGVGAEHGWESWVSLRARQTIDEGLTGEYRLSPHLDPVQREYAATHGMY